MGYIIMSMRGEDREIEREMREIKRWLGWCVSGDES